MRHERNISSLSSRGCIVLALLCLFLIPARYALGQVDEGAINGTVTDSTGAVVPGALVTLTNKDEGNTLQTKSNGNGEYFFSPVKIGHYTVTVTAKGFSQTTQENLTVEVAQHLLVNVRLALGTSTETVVVSEAPPLLQAEEASVGQVVDQVAINALPLNGRNFTFLAQLGAGVNTPQADTRGNAASGAFSANGLKPAQNNYLLDGIDNNSNAVDFLNGTNYVHLPPIEAIEEFKVQTADFSAELGRAGGAVLNASIKSGTNHIHGAAWEYFRNDILDAADFFEDNGGVPKGELRQNQFGGSFGGPILKNKIFIFGDYEGLRRVQGTILTATVPTVLEQSSNFTNLSDVIKQTNQQTRQDGLGRNIEYGTMLDPATTRSVQAGAVDPVSGLTNNTGSEVWVRDPFSSTCGPSTQTFTLGACPDLNQLPANRLDPNAQKILALYPKPTGGSVSTYSNSPKLFEHRNAYDVRGDANLTEKDQLFVRFSYADDPQFIPSVFGGIADGGSFQQGIQTSKSDQAVAGWTHTFSPNTVNEARAGFAHLNTARYGPNGTVPGIPEQFGIQGIPQPPTAAPFNGGLPNLSIGGLQTLGTNDYLPSNEVSQTLQITDDLTKIYGKHSFKAGVELQRVKFLTLQPSEAAGNFGWSGTYTDIPNEGVETGGMGQMLLLPTVSKFSHTAVPGAYDYSGGLNSYGQSNITTTDDAKNYTGFFLQDDWKVTPSLTLNLGIRWDYFGPIMETNGAQDNIVVPYEGNQYTGFSKATLLIPATGKASRLLSTGNPITGTANTPGNCQGPGCWGFVDLMANQGVNVDFTDEYGKGLVLTQKDNFSPRIGFADKINNKLVMRGGFGTFFNSFDNAGYGPNIGRNYPFQFNFGYSPIVSSAAGVDQTSGQVAPISYGTPYAGCTTAGPGGTAVLETAATCLNFSSTLVNYLNQGFSGIQFNYKTPFVYEANFTLQYSITPTLSATAGYVYTGARDLQYGLNGNAITQILPTDANYNANIPYPMLGGFGYAATVGQSAYHGLQTKLEKQYSNGLSLLFTYTFSKTMSDAGDQLNGGNAGGGRASNVPGLGPKFDYGLADFNIKQVLHASGVYDLPFGKDRRFLNQNGPVNTILGGWSTSWILTLEGGQPLNFGCPSGTTQGLGCGDIKVAGQSPDEGINFKTPAGDTHERPFWLNNPAYVNQPCQLKTVNGTVEPIVNSPANCIPLQGSLALGGNEATGQFTTPGFHRLDFTTLKNFKITERYNVTFQAQFFNIVNHPNFNAPNFGGNGVVSVGGSGDFTNTAHFGQIGSTRDAPYDPRQIQFAMTLHY